MQLICAFVFAYAKSRFSNDAVHFVERQSQMSRLKNFLFWRRSHLILAWRPSWTCDLDYLFLAYLSRRLTGELIGYPWIRRPLSVRRPFTFSNIFSSEPARPIKAKFYVEPPWEGGKKVCINGPGHTTKMAAMPIYGKNL